MLFTLAPILSLVPALVVFSVVPFGATNSLRHRTSTSACCSSISVTSIGVYGIILPAGRRTASNPLLASLRASAQLISYEIAVTMTLVSVILTAGHPEHGRHRRGQQESGLWFGFVQPVAFVLVLIGGLAETNRAPFDLPEAEQELTGGFHTEYSGMRFALFFLAEYANMIVITAVRDDPVLGRLAAAVPERRGTGVPRPRARLDLVLREDVRVPVPLHLDPGTLPRYRYDQLMRLGWKVLIPIAIANIVVTGVFKVLL